MLYLSTRGHPDPAPFESVLLDGLAPDGGLYLPESWPRLNLSGAHVYREFVAGVLAPFLAPDPLEAELGQICEVAYAGFNDEEVAPVRSLGDGHFLLELFWGPTLSFKDYALAVVGQLFDRVLDRTGGRILVLGATSGDTGSAAIEACRGRDNIDLVTLFPAGRVSDIQRRQMTTVLDPNIRTVAVQGTFDDCQALVKRAFADSRHGLRLTAFNSINWARVAAQSAYYFWAADHAAPGEVSFAVPTGNFGNVFAGWVAKRCGGPIGRFLISNNANHGLVDLVEHGRLAVQSVQPTVAPAMDIQIPSNLERYLFELAGGESAQVRRWQADLSDRGHLELDPDQHNTMREEFAAGWLDDAGVSAVIRKVHDRHGLILDPHTAIAWDVGERLRRPGETVVTIATAHPAKFGDVVAKALGFPSVLPPELADLEQRPERYEEIPNDYEALLALLGAGRGARGAEG
jgi:threonine synthase